MTDDGLGKLYLSLKHNRTLFFPYMFSDMSSSPGTNIKYTVKKSPNVPHEDSTNLTKNILDDYSLDVYSENNSECISDKNNVIIFQTYGTKPLVLVKTIFDFIESKEDIDEFVVVS